MTKSVSQDHASPSSSFAGYLFQGPAQDDNASERQTRALAPAQQNLALPKQNITVPPTQKLMTATALFVCLYFSE